MKDKLEIYSKGDYPANVLSNFCHNEFEIDGVKCGSMEGFLQSLKYKDQNKQREVCALWGSEAKSKGKRKFMWKLSGNIYWQGRKIKRTSVEFSALVRRAYISLLSNPIFLEALKASEGYELLHSIGKDSKGRTILTKEEFINNLNFLRSELTLKTKQHNNGY